MHHDENKGHLPCDYPPLIEELLTLKGCTMARPKKPVEEIDARSLLHNRKRYATRPKAGEPGAPLRSAEAALLKIEAILARLRREA